MRIWKPKKHIYDIINILVPKEAQVPEIVKNEKISINYVMNGIRWNQSEVNTSNVFKHKIILNVINDVEDKKHSVLMIVDKVMIS